MKAYGKSAFCPTIDLDVTHAGRIRITVASSGEAPRASVSAELLPSHAVTLGLLAALGFVSAAIVDDLLEERAARLAA